MTDKYKIVEVVKDVSLDEEIPYNYKEKRYIVVDGETGEVLDDAQGYGYKTYLKAIKGYSFKNKTPKQRKEYKENQKRVDKWIDKHWEFMDEYEGSVFYYQRCNGDSLKTKEKKEYLSELLEKHKIPNNEMTAEELIKFGKL